MVRRCAVVGSPISHSLSPLLHQAAYAWLGLDWRYGRFDLQPAALPGFVAGLDDSWRGLSCTMPLKRAVLALGQPDAAVQAVGAANTLVFDGPPGQASSTLVRNTDVTGLAAALRAAGLAKAASARVVGAGATAASALCALRLLGVPTIHLAARDLAARSALIERVESWPAALAEQTRPCRTAVGGQSQPVTLTAEPLDRPWRPVQLTVSTIPAPAAAALADGLVRATDAVFDVLYDPWPTPLAAAARRAGRTVLTGLDLLAHQAAGQVELMAGRPVPVAV
ncbi:MAG: shikimate dehydrogenase, partial [Propionibacteriaceae bacterium]|nr:shikimate dehydrogenase [Propionibacteriaceae bacterium]